jgi:phenylalanyl-tRNA synthetase alpha chain
MENYKIAIEKYKVEIGDYIISSEEQLEEYRKKYLGANGILKQVFNHLKQVPVDNRKEAGELLRGLKDCAENKYEKTLTEYIVNGN